MGLPSPLPSRPSVEYHFHSSLFNIDISIVVLDGIGRVPLLPSARRGHEGLKSPRSSCRGGNIIYNSINSRRGERRAYRGRARALICKDGGGGSGDGARSSNVRGFVLPFDFSIRPARRRIAEFEWPLSILLRDESHPFLSLFPSLYPFLSFFHSFSFFSFSSAENSRTAGRELVQSSLAAREARKVAHPDTPSEFTSLAATIDTSSGCLLSVGAYHECGGIAHRSDGE